MVKRDPQNRKIASWRRMQEYIKRQVVDFHKIELGIEVNYQIALQITLVLMTLTETATTSGLQTFFQQDSFLGIPMKPTTALIISSVWGLKTSVMLHLKTIRVQKIFFGTKSSIVVFLWGLMGSLKRILSMVFFFTPSLGVFSILNHWQAEQYPFEIKSRYNLIHRKDEVHMFNLTETVLWSELDRWNYYGDINDPTPPSYSLYTGLTLKWTFVSFLAIMIFQMVSLMMVKTFTSMEFKEHKKSNYRKFLHIVENLNCSFPYKDWDEDEGKSINKEDFKRRYEQTECEMIWSQAVNIVFSITMLFPIWFTGQLHTTSS